MPTSNKVFISYRRDAAKYLALAVFQDLDHHTIDAFIDYENIRAGNFLEIILGQIAARPYFLPILTPGTLDRCTNPDDILRQEIEEAIRDYGKHFALTPITKLLVKTGSLH